jgi:hypothetical protein
MRWRVLFLAGFPLFFHSFPSGGAAVPRGELPFIADDYPKALAAARAEKKPIFLEAWAPW